MNIPLKIGLVLNYKKAEKRKDELLSINSKTKPWLRKAQEKMYKKHIIISDKGAYTISVDVALGVYLEYTYPNVIIDYITPDEISSKRFKQNDIVFILIYDLLEAFHLSDKTKFYKYKQALKTCKNVYPPYQYQKFINNKCIYYKYLFEKGIPVAPTYCISKLKWFSKNPDTYVKNLLSKIKNKKWDSFITKPVYGQEAIGFSKFLSCNNTVKKCKSEKCFKTKVSNNKSTLDCQKTKIKKYLTKNLIKYKNIVVQKYINGFDKKKPEIRTYYINGRYMYSIITTATVNTGMTEKTPIQEGGKYKIPDEEWNYIRLFSQKVMDTLPKLNLSGTMKHPLVTRIDIGSGLEGVPYTYFINEVEFVPSLFIYKTKTPVLETLAQGLVEVGLVYAELKQLNQLPVAII